MTYIYDTSSFNALRSIFPNQFLNFWSDFNSIVKDGRIISTKEVFNELEDRLLDEDDLFKWISNNKSIFQTPTPKEIIFVAEIFSSDERYVELISKKSRLRQGYCADPFVVALAKIKGGVVVTDELENPRYINIISVCKDYSIEYTNLEGFMKQENLVY